MSGTGSAEPSVRGERALRRADAWLHRFDAAAAAVLPPRLDPFRQLGAVANTCFLIAVATGVLLLLWYVPSVHGAHASLEAMTDSPWTAQLARSLHRYSSDAAMLCVLLHALKVFVARRFTGPRWLAWITGIAALGCLWLTGWLGYWLVWDQRAHLVALGTARVLDVLPVVVDPLQRSFVSDATVNSLLFFVVFFAHMLLPLAMGVALWLHIARLARARFLTGRGLTLCIVVALAVVSLSWPATSAPAAHMAVPPHELTMDWWYLLPLALTDRLGGGALWAVALLATAVTCAAPWWMRRGKVRPAQVDASRCNACTLCVQDCPYGAIRMVPRRDGKDRAAQAVVDPSRCVGCGICAGSCDTAGIALPQLDARELRRDLERLLAQEPERNVAFVCAHAPGAGHLPTGWLAVSLPCIGWLHALTVERVLRRGGGEVAVVGCAGGSCRYREGAEWTAMRLLGQRPPALRRDRVDASRLHLAADVTALAAWPPATRGDRRRASHAVAVLLGLAALVTVLVAGSDAPYTAPRAPDPELVVSFKHPGQMQERRRQLSPEEIARLPVHMRRDHELERTRLPVRLCVRVDGAIVLQRTFAPSGLWSDGNSVGVVHLPVAAGEHLVEVAIGDGDDPEVWQWQEQRQLTFAADRRRVARFDRVTGFVWE